MEGVEQPIYFWVPSIAPSGKALSPRSLNDTRLDLASAKCRSRLEAPHGVATLFAFQPGIV